MLILASSSTSRAKILKDAGIKFTQISTDFDEEKIVAITPKSFVYQATLGKYNSIKKESSPILVADTVLEVDGKIVRKAKDKDDARRILKLQSENEFKIITCMIYSKKDLFLVDISYTTYQFLKFDEDALESYLDSGEWIGKAGACMVEGFCKPYIKNVIGYESSAMGLCVEKLKPFLD
jgi:septum formation protein